jgi:serine/threonine-protein kinase
MLSLRNIAIAQALLWLVALAQNAFYWQYLPERVATHFNGSGKPDGWMSRDNATMTMMAFQTLMPLMFIALGYAIYRIPTSLINIPHREFWFHPDRRDAAIQFIARNTAVFSLGLSLFFMGINHLTFRANTNGGVLEPVGFWILMACFLAFTCLWTFWLLARFRLPTFKTR